MSNSYNELFETYKNMRDRSEITAEIEAVEPIVGEEPDLEQNEDGYTDMSGIVNHFYHKGYLDALRWVKGEHDE
jgi:hypothetical protein